MSSKTINKILFPVEFQEGHKLSFMNHSAMVELLSSAAEHGSFSKPVKFKDRGKDNKLSNIEEVFKWLDESKQYNVRNTILRQTVFPALLSDLVHFIYEALDCSKNGKLGVCYALLRKPIKENLGLLESIAVDVQGFSANLAENPLALRTEKAGSIEAHTQRIANVLNIIGEEKRFDASYLAQLRYDKNTKDGFDGICNHALHLFTGHHAIRTENLNVNFIFSKSEARESQWRFLYSRMPYLLFYIRRLVEHVFTIIDPTTDPAYLTYL